MGILAGDGVLLLLHLLLDAAELLHGDPLLPPLALGKLSLLGEAGLPLCHELPEGHVGYSPAGEALAPELLQQDDPVGGSLDEGLVMGDEQHRAGEVPDQPLHPRQRIGVHIVGGLVQQPHVALFYQQTGHLQLHLLAAGQGAHELLAEAHVPVQPQPGKKLLPLPRVLLPEAVPGAEKLVNRLFLVRLAQLLGQIPKLFPLIGADALGFGVGLDHGGVDDPLEQGGLAVALLAHDHRLVPAIKRQLEILHQGMQVLPVPYVQISDLYRRNHLFFPPDEKGICPRVRTDP